MLSVVVTRAEGCQSQLCSGSPSSHSERRSGPSACGCALTVLGFHSLVLGLMIGRAFIYGRSETLHQVPRWPSARRAVLLS